jgi:hypothetical protein
MQMEDSDEETVPRMRPELVRAHSFRAPPPQASALGTPKAVRFLKSPVQECPGHDRLIKSHDLFVESLDIPAHAERDMGRSDEKVNLINGTHPDVAALYSRTRHEWVDGKPPRIRLDSVTATDLSTILGLNREYKQTQQSLLAKKLEIGKPTVPNVAMLHGQKVEPIALQAYTELTGRALVSAPLGFVRGAPNCGPKDYRMRKWIGATPDGIVKEWPIIVEVKVSLMGSSCYFLVNLSSFDSVVPA